MTDAYIQVSTAELYRIAVDSRFPFTFLNAYDVSIIILLNLARLPADPFQLVPHELPKSSSKGYSTHGVQQEVDAEVSVVEEHGELLRTPKYVRRGFLPKVVRKEHVDSYGIA